jgi:hypothetical protein
LLALGPGPTNSGPLPLWWLKKKSTIFVRELVRCSRFGSRQDVDQLKCNEKMIALHSNSIPYYV